MGAVLRQRRRRLNGGARGQLDRHRATWVCVVDDSVAGRMGV